MLIARPESCASAVLRYVRVLFSGAANALIAIASRNVPNASIAITAIQNQPILTKYFGIVSGPPGNLRIV
jgi:hypothetical protein